jgi:putative aldouronate transport system substrate-binding protein
MYQQGGFNPAEVIPKLIFTTDESDEITEIQSNLLTYVQENIAAFLTGAKDIDADWDAYVAELDKIGLAKYLEVVQGVYDRMY